MNVTNLNFRTFCLIFTQFFDNFFICENVKCSFSVFGFSVFDDRICVFGGIESTFRMRHDRTRQREANQEDYSQRRINVKTDHKRTAAA